MSVLPEIWPLDQNWSLEKWISHPDISKFMDQLWSQEKWISCPDILKFISSEFLLHAPEGLDGGDDTNVRVVKVVEAAKGEGGECPDQSLANVGDDLVATEEGRPNVVDDDGLNAPMRVENQKCSEDSICHGIGPHK